MNFFSIIVPVYNQEKQIEELIKSLLAQNYPKDSFEVIIVNNGSNDNSEFLIKKYNVKYVFEQKPSSYAARNAGAKIAKGNVFAFIDGDMHADNNWLSSVNKALLKYDIVGGKIINKDSSRKYLTYYDSLLVNPKRESNLIKKQRICGGNFFIFSSVYNNLGGFDSNLISGGDTLLSIHAIKSNFKIGYSLDSIAYHPVDSFSKRIKRNMRLAFGSIEKNKTENQKITKKSKISNVIKNIKEDFTVLKESLREKDITRFEFIILKALVIILKFFEYLAILFSLVFLKSKHVSRM